MTTVAETIVNAIAQRDAPAPYLRLLNSARGWDTAPTPVGLVGQSLGGRAAALAVGERLAARFTGTTLHGREPGRSNAVLDRARDVRP